MNILDCLKNTIGPLVYNNNKCILRGSVVKCLTAKTEVYIYSLKLYSHYKPNRDLITSRNSYP